MIDFFRRCASICRRTWPLTGFCLVIAVSSTAIFGQAGKKDPAESFADSPVDSIVALIKNDLKALKPTVPTTPEQRSTESSKPQPPIAAPSGPRVPISLKTITSPRVRVVETNAQKCQTPEEAVLLYQIFLAGSDVTDDEKKQAKPRLEFWEQMVTDQYVRVGTKWIPKSEADALMKEADALVVEAMEMLNINNYAAANSKLERASRVYPDHLESVFLLAVGAYLKHDYKAAEAKFTQCLARAPNNVGMLNNVATCEVLIKRFDHAVKHWEKAASIDLGNKDVAQNLGQFISDANLKTIGNVDRHVIEDASEIYQKMITKAPKNRANSNKGYVLTRTIRPKPGESAVEENRTVGNGTGFVIAKGFILTNRHVVEDADVLAIQDPAKPDGVLAAKVIGTSKDLDLALLECQQLKAAAVPINATAVGRGTEVMALGFPITTVVGKGLKATRGIVTGLAADATDGMMVLDVQVNPGNSGGPLCDRTGRVVGIVTAKTFTATFVQGYGLAIPINEALPFIKKHLKDYSSPATDATPVEWTEVDAQISPSTVMILIQKK